MLVVIVLLKFDANKVLSVVKSKNFVFELKLFFVLFVISFVLFQLVFFRSGVWVNLSAVFALFYLWVFPLFPFMFVIRSKLNYLESYLLVILFNFGVISSLSYFFTIFGYSFSSHPLVLPIGVFVVSCVVVSFLISSK